MVSPQERQTIVRLLSGTRCRRSTEEVEGVYYDTCSSAETGGSATELSAADAWHRAAVGGEPYVRLIRTIARSNLETMPGIDDFPIPLLAQSRRAKATDQCLLVR